MKMNQTVYEEISSFTNFLKEDYKVSTIKQYTTELLKYLQWKNSSESNQRKELKQAIIEYTDPRSHIIFRSNALKSTRAALHLFYTHLTGTTFSSSTQKTQINDSVETEISKYKAYIANVVGLSENTQISHCRYLKRFLYYIFPAQKIDYSALSADVVQGFITNEINNLTPASKKSVIGILRSYIRYLTFNMVRLNKKILALPLRMPVWKYARVPKTFQNEEINKILASYDQNTTVGLRDYAIALCFTELGLRASEVASLALDDINWRECKILIKKTKTHTDRELPLSHKLGQAIVHYLKDARPKTSERLVFVRFAHRCGESMGREQIRGTIRRAYARAEISSTITGTHILRHSKAKSMYENGSDLKMIADVLGHESIDTTVIYTKISRSALYCVVCPWPISTDPEACES